MLANKLFPITFSFYVLMTSQYVGGFDLQVNIQPPSNHVLTEGSFWPYLDSHQNHQVKDDIETILRRAREFKSKHSLNKFYLSEIEKLAITIIKLEDNNPNSSCIAEASLDINRYAQEMIASVQREKQVLAAIKKKTKSIKKALRKGLYPIAEDLGHSLTKEMNAADEAFQKTMDLYTAAKKVTVRKC
ncbi:MAG: hypothetical protein AAFY71_26490 [Bacteroidota bacterium]